MGGVTAVQHAVALGTSGAGLTQLRAFVQVVAVVAHADGVVGLGARRVHAVETCALRAGLTSLEVTGVLGEGFACR